VKKEIPVQTERVEAWTPVTIKKTLAETAYLESGKRYTIGIIAILKGVMGATISMKDDDGVVWTLDAGASNVFPFNIKWKGRLRLTLTDVNIDGIFTYRDYY